MASPRAWRGLRLLMPVGILALAVALAVGVGVVVVGAVGGGGAGSAGGVCDPGAGSLVDAGPAVRAVTVGTLDAEQRDNAATIIGVVKGLSAPPRASLVALATAMAESGLRNLTVALDHDSLGLFQQRPSQGWGAPAQVTDPVAATTTFLHRLLAIPGWEQLPVTVAAQLVQRSAFPNAYAKWEVLAGALVAALSGAANPIGCTGSAAVTNMPDGVAKAAATFALGERGKPYVWGATGPDTYDCSGLMLRAFQAAGVILPRTSREQYWAGAHVPVEAAQPGDLLFWSSAPDNPDSIHHVALYLGDGQIAEAPDVGLTVRARAVSFTEHELVRLATRPGSKT